MRDDMDGVLSTSAGSYVVRRVVTEGFGDEAAQEWLLAALDNAGGDAGQVNWAEQPHHSRLFADRLEKLVVDKAIKVDDLGELVCLEYVPIMVRVCAGSEALAGERFDWSPQGKSGLYAVSSDGTDWDIFGSEGRWEITVARWDYPDYVSSDLERAKRIAEQLSAFPKPNTPNQQRTNP